MSSELSIGNKTIDYGGDRGISVKMERIEAALLLIAPLLN